MSDARILERGYRPYDGPRLGVPHAVRSLWVQTLRHLLGLGRPARSKILPVLTIVFAYVPTIVFVGVISLFGDRLAEPLIPVYADSYGFIVSAIVLFVTFVAPESLCPDRRSKVLSLYLASPLSRRTYLLAKFAAVMTILLAVTLGPPLLLLLGYAAQGVGPDGILGFLGTLGRIVASGVVMALVYGLLSLAVASLTDRRAVAAAGVLLTIIGSSAVTSTLHFALDVSRSVMAFNLFRAPFDLVSHIYGEGGLPPIFVPWVVLAAGLGAITLVSAAILIWRYETLQVTR
ncbi:MAG: ABC transporter permease [Acidimicrobiales bacterium]